MTVEDLIKAGKDQVRRNPDLMTAYIQLFSDQFGRKPDCAGCTFNYDWQRLTNSTNIQNLEIMSDKTFRLKKTAIIYSYDVDDKKLKRKIRKRSYGNVMTEEFAENFLTYGTAEQIAERKKQFAVLPAKFIEDDGLEDAVNLSKLTVKQLQEIATEKEFPSEEWQMLKKEKLVAYIDAKLIESEANEDVQNVVDDVKDIVDDEKQVDNENVSEEV